MSIASYCSEHPTQRLKPQLPVPDAALAQSHVDQTEKQAGGIDRIPCGIARNHGQQSRTAGAPCFSAVFAYRRPYAVRRLSAAVDASVRGSTPLTATRRENSLGSDGDHAISFAALFSRSASQLSGKTCSTSPIFMDGIRLSTSRRYS